MRDLINGLKCIHGKGIIHRDLKSGNLLIGDENELIISDFGLAIENNVIDNRFTGTPSYIAPELWNIENPPYSEASDIFSLGCILYEIYTLKIAFNGKGNKEIGEKIINTIDLNYERMNGEKIPEVEGLIKRMLVKDPNKRIKMNDVEKIINSLFLPNQLLLKIIFLQ